MILENTIIFNEKDRKEVAKSIEQGNRRENNIIKIPMNKLTLNSITLLNNNYYIYSSTVRINKEDKYICKLNLAISINCKKSIDKEFKLAEKLHQKCYIAVVINEQCSTFITRRELGNKHNCDIPLSLHSIYGEYLYGNNDNIKNKEFINEYLKLIDSNTYKTRYNSKIWYVHLPFNGTSYYNLFDNNYIEAIKPFNSKIVYKFKGDLLYGYLTDTLWYEDIVIEGTEKYLANKLMNSIYYKYNKDTKLEIRVSSPVNKPSRLRVLNDLGMTYVNTGIEVPKRNQSNLYYDTQTLISPKEIKKYDREDIGKLFYTKLLSELQKLGLTWEYVKDRLAIIEDKRFILISLDENYNII